MEPQEIHYGLKQPLRFSKREEHRNNHKVGGEGRVFSVLMPTNMLLPFQLQRTPAAISITSVIYKNINTGAETDVFSNIISGQIALLHFTTHDQLIHFGSVNLQTNLPEGEYYIIVSDSINTWYSEDVRLGNFSPAKLINDNCVKTIITYWDTCNIDNIVYNTTDYALEQYKHKIYLDVEVAAPEYDYDVEGEEDGETEFVPEYIKLEKRYNLELVAPEPFVDALSLIPLHIKPSATVEVTSWRGTTTKMKFATMTPEWQGSTKTWAKVTIEFITSTVLHTNCCATPLEISTACITEDAEALATIDFQRADLSGTSDDYQNSEYTSDSTGLKVPILENEKVLIRDIVNNTFTYAFRTAVSFQPVFTAFLKGQVMADINQIEGTLTAGQEYYFSDGFVFRETPIIDYAIEQADSGLIQLQGATWNRCVVNVWVKRSIGVDVLIGQVTGDDFNLSGYEFDPPQFAEEVYIICEGLTCTLGQSVNVEITPATATGIGIMRLPGGGGIATNIVG